MTPEQLAEWRAMSLKYGQLDGSDCIELLDEIEALRKQVADLQRIKAEHAEMCAAVGRDTLDGRAVDDITDLAIERDNLQRQVADLTRERDEERATAFDLWALVDEARDIIDQHAPGCNFWIKAADKALGRADNEGKEDAK